MRTFLLDFRRKVKAVREVTLNALIQVKHHSSPSGCLSVEEGGRLAMKSECRFAPKQSSFPSVPPTKSWNMNYDGKINSTLNSHFRYLALVQN